jgi:hypothetical protein
MRIAIGVLSIVWLLTGCKPDPADTPGDGGDTRPGAAQEDTGTDRPPAGSSSENAAPPVRPAPTSPGTSATQP